MWPYFLNLIFTFFFCSLLFHRKVPSHKKITENGEDKTLYPQIQAWLKQQRWHHYFFIFFLENKNNDLIRFTKFAKDVWDRDSVIQRALSWPSVSLASAAGHIVRGLNRRMWLDCLSNLSFCSLGLKSPNSIPKHLWPVQSYFCTVTGPEIFWTKHVIYDTEVC